MMTTFTSMESFMEATRESTKEFTPQQLEAQEAMQETAAERTPEYWNSLATKELNENGESDAYREYLSRANGNVGQGSEISFGAKSKSELESEIKWQMKLAESDAKKASEMAKENAEGKVYNPKNLISDRIYSSSAHAKKARELQEELKKL